MPETALESALRRDRLLVAASLAALTALAWAYLIQVGHTMSMDAETALAPGMQPWDVGRFGLMFIMWAVMMVGMMTPSAAPMILLYARVGRQAEARGTPLAATGYFAAGYLLAWTVFSLAATLGQWALESSLLLSPALTSTSAVFGGLVLIYAGIYQWTPLKDACLENCRSPLSFIQSRGGFQRDAAASLNVGFQHGLYCVGCCWALMALLFVGGVMNFLWIVAIAIFVLAEKILPGGPWPSRAAGVVLAAGGVWLLATAWS